MECVIASYIKFADVTRIEVSEINILKRIIT